MNRPPTPDVSDDQQREHSLPEAINIKVLQFPFLFSIYAFRYSIIFRLAREFVILVPVCCFFGYAMELLISDD